MKKAIWSLTTVCLLIGISTNSFCQTKTKKTMKTITSKESKEVVKDFFTAFGNGDFDGVMNTFHDSCKVIAIRDGARKNGQLYGRYEGKEGAKEFLSSLGNTFDTKAFTIENIIGENDVSFANGKFTHVIKSTGKSFSSDWSLMCIIKDNRIIEYHFYEDSETFAESNK